MARARLAPSGSALSWWVLCLAVGCAQSESRAPFFNPMGSGGTQGTIDGDGGQLPPQDGGTTGGSGGTGISGGGGIAGSTVTGGSGGGPDVWGVQGDPATFDPAQVYVRGSFDSLGLDHENPYAEPCADFDTGIADWSSPLDDWQTDLGLTVVVPCEVDDVRIRADGSITYEHIDRTVNLLKEEVASTEPGSATITVMPAARPHDDDPHVVGCWRSASHPQFRHFVHPESGALVYVCWPAEGDAPYAHFTAVGDINEADDPFPVPDGYIVEHLGYDDYALVHKLDDPNDMGVSSGATDVEPVAIASMFGFQDIQAVRATQDGFLLLIMRAPAPPELELWSLSYQGELAQVGASASGAEIDLNEDICPIRGGAFGSDIIDKLPRAGCMCALEPDGTALCLAREGAGDEILVRFEFGESSPPPETVYRVTDDPFLQTFQGLITGS